MAYYHVGIRATFCYEARRNIIQQELEERFISPYLRGKPVAINGVAIATSDILQIQIYRTQAVLSADHAISNGEDVTNELITGPPGSESDPDEPVGQRPRPPTDAREVFVVHGRNEPARKAMFEFLSAIRLQPLEWSEAVQATGRPSPYIGEILNAAFSRAHAVVVLLTPDDEAQLREPLRAPNDPPTKLSCRDKQGRMCCSKQAWRWDEMKIGLSLWS